MQWHKASFLTVLSVTGEDRSSFLQGQLSCDMDRLPPHYQFAALCNPKGRIISLLHLRPSDEEIQVLLPHEIGEKIHAHLSRFIFRSQVELKLRDDLGVYVAFDAAEQSEDSLSIKPDVQVLATDSAPESLVDQDPEPRWHQVMHEAGIPQIDLTQSEQWLPEALNLDLLDAINFEKGCYTGQEIIARMHYLGKAKKRLYILNTESGHTLNDSAAPGSSLVSAEQSSAGNIFSVSPDQRYALAVLDTAYVTDHKQIYTSSGDALDISTPAYWQ